MTSTSITASTELPLITIIRDFDAPVAKVFNAHTDPLIYAQWLGPKDVQMAITQWDCQTGGRWAYHGTGSNGSAVSFFGSFHEVRANERIVQTFTFTDYPDSVTLETLVLEELSPTRTRITGTSMAESFFVRDMILESGMEVGVNEGYAKLDALLA